jgi:glutamate-1-semialdehyde aminotransferase
MWGFFLTPTPVTDYATAKTADTARFARLFHALLAEGVYIAPVAVRGVLHVHRARCRDRRRDQHRARAGVRGRGPG